MPARRPGADGVIDPLPDESVLVEFGHGPGEVSHLVELLGVGSVGPFYVAVEFGGAGGNTKRRIPRCWQASSKTAWNSEPPSTWMARTGKGVRSSRLSRKRLAAGAVARLATIKTSQRDNTSRAVKRFNTTPGRGRRSRVSTCTRSPGKATP